MATNGGIIGKSNNASFGKDVTTSFTGNGTLTTDTPTGDKIATFTVTGTLTV